MKQFLNSILPSKGVLFIANKSKSSSGGMQHFACDSVDQCVDQIQLLALGNDEVFYACASFENESYVNTEGKIQRRTKENAQFSKSFWLDIECTPEKAKAGNGYPDIETGHAGLQAFLKQTGLPNPIIVKSGGGMHVYWPMTEDVNKSEWLSVASDLKKLTQMREIDLIVDDDRTADIASLLRPPETLNHKYNPSRPVKVFEMAEPTELGEFQAIVSHALATASPNASTSTNNGYTRQYQIPDTVEEGARNSNLLSFVGHLRKQRVPEGLILGVANDFNNARCSPPLCANEVKDIVGRFSKQANPDLPEPTEIKCGLPDVPEFNVAMLPDVFQAFVKDNAERMGQPPDCFGIPLMINAAAALGSNWAVCPKAHDEGWKESMVLWGGIVAPPGSKKSACLSITLQPIHKIVKELGQQHQLAMQNYSKQKQAFDAQQKRIKSKGTKVPVSNALTEPQVPKPERILVQDITYQKLADLMSVSPRGLLCMMDELAGVMSKWDENSQEAARQFFLTAWNGDQPYVVDRVEAGTKQIDRAFLCLVGGFQPAVLAQYVKQTLTGGEGDDGLIQRFQMLGYPDFCPSINEVDRVADAAAEDEMENAILRLHKLKASDVYAKTDPKSKRFFLHFSDQAQVIMDGIRHELQKVAMSSKHGAARSSHLTKMSATVAKLAMLIHFLDGGSGPISVDAALKAFEWCKYLNAHSKRVYESAPVGSENAAKQLLNKIRSGDLPNRFTERDVIRKGWVNLTSKSGDLEHALALLIDHHWLRKELVSTGGRPSEVYIIHPSAQKT